MDKVLRKPDLKKAKRLYDELLLVSVNIKNAAGQNASNIFDYVATTNYDLVLESYARGTKRSYYLTNRGFQPIPGEKTEYLNLDYLRNSPMNVNYLKLHGSLDWWERNDGKIVISEGGKPAYGETNQSTERTCFTYTSYVQSITLWHTS